MSSLDLSSFSSVHYVDLKTSFRDLSRDVRVVMGAVNGENR